MRFSLAIQAIVLIIIFPVKFSCAEQTEWRGRADVIDGVVHISNPRDPIFMEKPFSLEEPLRVGMASGNEEYIFQEIGAIGIDDAENIYISDWKESHIKVFDKNGVYLKTIGRKGQGPGEFERISRLQIIDQNRLWVFDGNRKQISIFNENCEFEQSIPLQKASPLDVLVSSTKNYIVKTIHLDPVSAKAGIAINVYNSNIDLIKTLAVDQPQDVYIPFQPFYVWTLSDEHILLGRNDCYTFGIYNPNGEIQKKISRDYRPVEISPGEKAKALKDLQQPANKKVPVHHPAYRSMITDGRGHIIVQTYEKPGNGEGYFYDVYNFDGKYLARMILEYSPKIWEKDKIYAIGEDEDGFQYLLRYSVKWLIE